jgi:hypothetical protein
MFGGTAAFFANALRTTRSTWNWIEYPAVAAADVTM